MTGRLKAMDKENEIESDWKFAAMVIDRCPTLPAIDRSQKPSMASAFIFTLQYFRLN